MAEQYLYTLDSSLDEYLIQRGISSKKNYASFLNSAKWAWKDLFQNTIYSVQSEWKTLQKGDPYDYVELPPMVRFFGAYLVDDCGNLIPIYYNNRMNVVAKPTTKKCGCSECDCSGLCEEMNSMIYTTKLLFNINGVDYYEKIWVKVCPNGDIIEYREVPTKKYNNFQGDGGDYMNDYNNDYSIAPPNSDFTVVTETFQKTYCNIKLKPCGCPENTTENINLIVEHCCGYLPCNSRLRRKPVCDTFLGDINNNCLGEVKVSECNTKLFYRPLRKFGKVPESILVNYQTSGDSCNVMSQVPEYAVMALWAGIDYYSKRFNNYFGLAERQEAKRVWNDERNNVVLYLNNFQLEELADFGDARPSW